MEKILFSFTFLFQNILSYSSSSIYMCDHLFILEKKVLLGILNDTEISKLAMEELTYFLK